MNFKKNILLVNKPINWTSNDVLNKIKKTLNIKKAGHSGTLDPLATGLLIVGINDGTKQLNDLILKDKEYYAEITFGYSTDTYDLEGKIINITKIIPSIKDIINKLNELKKHYLQVPPTYSAIKINGKKSYELARSGKEFKLTPKEVKLYDYKIIEFNNNTLKINLKVSKGFYIRSLAYDLGKFLNSEATLTKLIRTKIGDFSLEQAIEVKDIHDYWFKLQY